MRNTLKLTKLDEQGVTMLEVLIASVIGIVVAFAVARSSISATQAQRASELELAFVAMMSRIENGIDDPVLCPSLFKTWDGADFVAPIFDHTGGSPVVQIHRLVDGSTTDVARRAANGGPTEGLTVEDMNFKEPIQVSGNTYDWTFYIRATKVAPSGAAFQGNPTQIKRIRMEVTTTGAPDYTATYCGPPVSPEANQQVPLLRFTAASPFCDDGNTNDNWLDAACSAEFGPRYVAGSLQDLVQFRMFFYFDSAAGAQGIYANAYRFAVADLQTGGRHIFTNSIDPTAGSPRPQGTIVDIGVANPAPGPIPPPDNCYVPCIRNTAPLRFVRGFFAAGVAGKTALCQANIGQAYVAASINDMARFGFRLANNDVLNNFMPAGAPGAVFEGGYACRMGWTTNPLAGPALDCAVAGNFPLACALR